MVKVLIFSPIFQKCVSNKEDSISTSSNQMLPYFLHATNRNVHGDVDLSNLKKSTDDFQRKNIFKVWYVNLMIFNKTTLNIASLTFDVLAFCYLYLITSHFHLTFKMVYKFKGLPSFDCACSNLTLHSFPLFFLNLHALLYAS